MEEIWINIENSKYYVSNTGKIKSTSRNHSGSDVGYEFILKPCTRGNYLYCSLRIGNDKRRSYAVHRVVAKSFLMNKENKSQVNHIDGDHKNNNVWNLEWNTAKENSQHSAWMGLNGTRKLVLNMETGIYYNSISLAAQSLNIPHSTLKSRLNGYRLNTTQFIKA